MQYEHPSLTEESQGMVRQRGLRHAQKGEGLRMHGSPYLTHEPRSPPRRTVGMVYQPRPGERMPVAIMCVVRGEHAVP